MLPVSYIQLAINYIGGVLSLSERMYLKILFGSGVML